MRVLVDGDPGYTQIRALIEEEELGDYDHYYSVGRNVGTEGCSVPTFGKQWRPMFDPVVVDLFTRDHNEVRGSGNNGHRGSDVHGDTAATAPFTTMMFWQSYRALDYNGVTYGQKDVEFAKFMELPQRTAVDLELTVAGSYVPSERLEAAGWRLRNPLVITKSFDSFRDYITASRGEFSVCKNVYVETNSGFFSDRSAAYLASGRPVVMQETGFSAHLPCGQGLFAVRTLDEAAAALDAINTNYPRHAGWARELAVEHLDARKVLAGFLTELGL